MCGVFLIFCHLLFFDLSSTDLSNFGINTVLNMPISSEGKRSLLVSDYEMTEEQALIIIPNEQAL